MTAGGVDDRELEVVYEIICTHAAGEVPDHPRYHRRAEPDWE